VKNKGRYLLLLIIMSVLFIAFKPISKPASSIIYETYIVQQGETLWSIAREFPHEDIRKFIYEIEKVNKTTAYVKWGQVLKIPVYK
jgi:LysM repeat protein